MRDVPDGMEILHRAHLCTVIRQMPLAISSTRVGLFMDTSKAPRNDIYNTRRMAKEKRFYWFYLSFMRRQQSGGMWFQFAIWIYELISALTSGWDSRCILFRGGGGGGGVSIELCDQE